MATLEEEREDAPVHTYVRTSQFKGISNIDLQAAKIKVLNQERKSMR
jgi:hypothetical protein